jgi:hypothetical protein
VGSPRTFYVRPGVGLARHAHPSFEQRGDLVIATNDFDWGLAAGVAAGREVPVPHFPVNVEVATFLSRGEDNTNSRWTTAVQVVREIHF